MAPHALRYRALPRWSLVWRCEVSVSSTRLFALFLFFLPQPLLSQQSSSQELFHKNCAGCHGEDARGTAKAPGLAMNQRVAEQSTEQLSTFLEQWQYRVRHAVLLRSVCRRPGGARQISASSQCGNNYQACSSLVPTRKITLGAATTRRLAHL